MSFLRTLREVITFVPQRLICGVACKDIKEANKHIGKVISKTLEQYAKYETDSEKQRLAIKYSKLFRFYTKMPQNGNTLPQNLIDEMKSFIDDLPLFYIEELGGNDVQTKDNEKRNHKKSNP